MVGHQGNAPWRPRSVDEGNKIDGPGTRRRKTYGESEIRRRATNCDDHSGCVATPIATEPAIHRLQHEVFDTRPDCQTGFERANRSGTAKNRSRLCCENRAALGGSRSYDMGVKSWAMSYFGLQRRFVRVVDGAEVLHARVDLVRQETPAWVGRAGQEQRYKCAASATTAGLQPRCFEAMEVKVCPGRQDGASVGGNREAAPIDIASNCHHIMNG